MNEALKVASLSKSFGAARVLVDLDFECVAGSLTAITGPSGCGKSTLLNIVGLLEDASSGAVTFEGVRISDLSSRSAARFRRTHLGYLFQNYALIENATVRENLAVVLPAGRFHRPVRERMEAALSQVGLAAHLSIPVSALSGGEQQRVALARLLLKQPRLVLADEPTGALDSANAEQVMRLLRELAASGATVLVATHSSLVVAQCDRELRLDQAPARALSAAR